MEKTMPSSHATWEKALERYKGYRDKHDIRESTRRAERRMLAEARREFASTATPHDLTEEMVLEFFLKLKTDRGLATKSRAYYATALRGFLRYTGAPAQRWIPRLPQGGPKDEGRYLESDERARLWAACVTPEDELILGLGLGMGFRRSDTLGARLADFEPSPPNSTFVTVHGKGEKWHPVTLELHPKVREILPRFLAWRTARIAGGSSLWGMEPTDPGTMLVASSPRYGISSMKLTTYDKRIGGIYARAGVDPSDWPSHNLRRTWAENRLKAALDEFTTVYSNPAEALEMALRVVQREGRWKSAETLRRYLRRQPVDASSSLAKTAV